MKSLQELINDADDIQKRLTQHKVDLYEYAESLNENHVVDIDKLMMKASHCKIEHHILQDINDDYVIGSYLQLLLSVAQVNIIGDKGEYHPALYACRIAAALPKFLDMNMLFQSSMILDEKGISGCVDVLLQHKLAEIFVFDALVLTCSYDTGNEGKFSYIADLAALFAMEKEQIDEILILVTTVVMEQEKLEYNFEFIDLEQFIFVLLCIKNKTDININSKRFFVWSFRNLKELAINPNKQKFSIEGYQIIFLHNITVFVTESDFNNQVHPQLTVKNFEQLFIFNCDYDKEKSPFAYTGLYAPTLNLENGEKVTISNCHFMNYTSIIPHSSIQCKNVNSFHIQSCSFMNLDCYLSDSERDISKTYGFILNNSNVKKVAICDSSFIDCRISRSDGPPETNYKRFFLDGKLILNNCVDEIKTENCIVENSCNLS